MIQFETSDEVAAEIDAIAEEIGWDPHYPPTQVAILEWMVGICKGWLHGTLPKRGGKP